jgi:hypothetical protein
VSLFPDDVARAIELAPLPTGRTLRRRRSLWFQAVRFAVFNVRMLRMVTAAH